MRMDSLTDAEVQLTARALSIHRVSMRRKLDRLDPDTIDYASTLREIEETQILMNKLNKIDLQRVLAE